MHTNCPWFTSDIVKHERSLGKTERTYRCVPSPENLLSFTNHRKFYKSHINKAQSSYYINIINIFSNFSCHICFSYNTYIFITLGMGGHESL